MEGKLLVIENDEFILKLVAYKLQQTAHEVVAIARTRKEARSAFKAIKAGRMACNGVLFDANITPGGKAGEDGRHIRKYIDNVNQALPQESRLKAIGFSAAPMKGYGIHVDFDLTKAGIPKIAKVLDDL